MRKSKRSKKPNPGLEENGISGDYLVYQNTLGCFIYILDSSNSIVKSHFELVRSVLALEATEPVSEPVTQMAVELINNHLISVQRKR